ncbi:MAG: hypothetical protein ACT4PV_08655 [Planctomycetaceae bacterium]
MRPRALLPLLLLSLGLLFAADGDEPAARGRRIFHDTQEATYPSCADCHALVPEAKEAELERRGPGGTLYGAAVREGWRNLRTYANVGEALQYCAKMWQKRKQGLQGGELADLVAFLAEHAPEEALPMRKVQKEPKLLEELDGGDAEKGEALAERWCGACHHDGETALSSRLRPASKPRDALVRKVRGYDAKRKFRPQEGSMSYYTNDRLPDPVLLDILAYLGK